jgi:GTP-binding protein Era
VSPEDTSCGFCAVIGAPNAGKSTLVNQLTGAKVSIVTHKVQTTRTRIRAIFVEDRTQVVLVDTPGIFEPRRKLDEAMVESAWTGAGEADAVLLLVDAASGLNSDVKRLILGVGKLKQTPILILNKIDLIERTKLLETAKAFNEAARFSATFMISALKGSGTADLKRHIAKLMPRGPWLYPGDQTADIQLRFLASEITREKLFLRLHNELPYQSTVETEAWEECKDGSVKINQVIYVARDSQKKIAIGAGGKTIREIGAKARKELEQLLERKVHLFLFGKVRENWENDPERLRLMGL